MKATIKNLVRDDSGATLVEYGLLITLIAIAALAALTFFGGNVKTLFSNVAQDV